jgi:oligoribonuclease NrnB/cAMP/cGMP phosphodiesterase (DHH superfamily)
MKTGLVIYHGADLDGILSGYLMQQFLEEDGISGSIPMIAANYGDPIPKEFQEPLPDVVAVVDFSYSMDILRELSDRTQVIWIDHHKSIIETFEKAETEHPFSENLDVLLQTNLSAVELTWDYCSQLSVGRSTQFHPATPLVVCAVGAWDIKRYENVTEETTEEMQFYLRSLKLKAYDERWQGLLDDTKDWDVPLMIGRALADWEKNGQKLKAKHCHRISWEGQYWVVQLGTAIPMEVMWENNPGDYIGLLGVNFIAPNWVVNLRRRPGSTIDLSDIAKKHGGGGHPGAAGFTTDKFPEELFRSV